MVESTTIDRRKLYQHVAAHLERMILSGEMPPGERLPPETQLMATFAVGRSAIRQALITLESAGLIEISNGQPARVARPSTSGLLSTMMPLVRHLLSTAEGNRQLQAIRLLVEVGLVRQAAKTVTPDLVADLKAALAANYASLSDVADFIESDVALHFTIAKYAGDPVLLAIHKEMHAWLHGQRKVALRAEGEALRGANAHKRIVAAIEAGDPDAAEAAMRDHLNSGREAYWSNI